MTKKEAAIVSAYTGYLIGEFHDFHEYLEKILNRIVFTHELGDLELAKEIQDKSFFDFKQIEVR
jgi:hypothetical protein